MTMRDKLDLLGRRGAEAVRTRWSVDAHLAQYLDIVNEVREEKEAEGARVGAR